MKLHFLVLGLALLLFSCVHAPAEISIAHAAVAHFSVVAESTSIQPSSDVARFEFGRISIFNDKPIEHTFTLRNDNAEPLRLELLRPSCGCTTALVGGRPGDDVRDVVAPPKGEILIRVSVDPAHLSPGEVEKSVFVLVRGQSEPAATLIMSGTLQSGATFQPAAIDFGNVVFGHESVQKIRVDLDASFPHAERAPKLLTSSSSIVVSEGTSSDGTGSNGKSHQYQYTVRISSYPFLGQVSAMLSVVRPDAPNELTPSNITVPVTGHILGDIVAAPETVAFGAIAEGKSASQTITLTGNAPGTVAGLKIMSVSPEIDARIDSIKDSIATLKVTTKPTMKVGSLQTQIIVATVSGQQLLLPVYVYVAAQ